MWRVTPFTSTFNHFSSILLDPQVSFVCWTILLLFFTCTNIIDSGEPDPSSPDLLYFLCVPLSGFLFLPPLSFSLSFSLSLSLSLCPSAPRWQLDYCVSMQSQKAAARQNHVLSHPWLLHHDEAQQCVTMGTRGSRRRVLKWRFCVCVRMRSCVHLLPSA